MGFYLTRNRKYKKQQKNSKNFENTIIASFQAKIGWERSRKRENKNNRSDGFQPDPEQKIPKKQQKNSKNFKTPSQLRLKPKQFEKGREKEKIKITVLMGFNPTRNRKFQKNSKKFKKFRNTIIASFQVKIGWERPRKRENKKNKNRSYVFLLDSELKISKKQLKNSKNQKTPSQLLSKTKQVGNGRERENIKRIILMCAYPTHNRKF